MVEDSGAVQAAAQQQSLFPSDSAPPVVPAPLPVEKFDTPHPKPDVNPPSVLPDAILIASATPPPVPSPNPSDSIEPFLYKNHLHEYTQKSRIPLPVYQTVNEGPLDLPKYRSTVWVDEVCYVSPNTFHNRKGAEHDAARIALEYISKKIKDDGFLLLHEDLMFCKCILSEYTDKMNLEKPMYKTKQHKGPVPIFQSTLVFDGMVYTGDVSKSKKEAEQLAGRAAILSLFGDAGNPKSQKTLAKIISSKVRLHGTWQKVKDLNPSQTQFKPMPENTQEHVAMAVNKDKEVEDASLVNGLVSGETSEVPLTMTHFRPEFRSTKPEPTSTPVSLPVEFVPSTLEEPIGDHATGSKRRSKRSKNKKARKKLCVENRSTKPEPTSPPVRLPVEFVPSTLEEPIGDHATGSKRRSKRSKNKKARKKLCVENRVATTTSQIAPCSVVQ